MNKAVAEIVEDYPLEIAERFTAFRTLVYQVAESETLGKLEESLKWGQPSYSMPGGSAVRFEWKHQIPGQYSVCFHCATCLVETFRELYADQFRFQGNRALVFDVEGELPERELGVCIALALRYHEVKHLPLLGVES